MISLGKLGKGVSRGLFKLEVRKGKFGLDVSGSVAASISAGAGDEEVTLVPILFPERYYIDVEPDVVVPVRGRVQVIENLPVGVQAWLGNILLGEVFPTVKRAYIGEPHDGFFTVFVGRGQIAFPSVEVRIEAVNRTRATRYFDEVSLNSAKLTVFQDGENWVSERLVISVTPDEMIVDHTDTGPGEPLLKGAREPEINRRFKRLAGRLRDVF